MRLNQPQEPESEVQRVPWSSFFRAFREDFNQGDHVSVLGPTRSGKTYLTIEIAECREWVMFLATKKKDPLIRDLQQRGYRVTPTLSIEMKDGLPERRVVFWPQPWNETKGLKDIHQAQKEAMSEALEFVYYAGNWCVVADEALWLSDKLRLGDELEHHWFQGRTSGVSLIASAQRPAWVPRAMYSQADHIFLFQTNDHEDLKRLGDIGGLNVNRIRYEVSHLGNHEFLYVGSRTGVLLKSKVER